MWFYKESPWYKQRLQFLCGSTKNHTGTNRDSRVYVVLQRIILVKIETPISMWFYKESYWYNQRFQGLCGSTKNHTGTNRDPRVQVILQRILLVQMKAPVSVVLQRIMLVQLEIPGSMWFYKEQHWYKQGLQGLCCSTKNNTGTNIDSRTMQFYALSSLDCD